jgi:hypothetical protein
LPVGYAVSFPQGGRWSTASFSIWPGNPAALTSPDMRVKYAQSGDQGLHGRIAWLDPVSGVFL